jgi:hypothetical protein
MGPVNPGKGMGTRLMYWEDNNSQNLANGKYGLRVVWARLTDLTSWTTLDQYEAIRHPLICILTPMAYTIEGSPFAGEEHIVYASRIGLHADSGRELVLFASSVALPGTLKHILAVCAVRSTDRAAMGTRSDVSGARSGPRWKAVPIEQENSPFSQTIA